MSCRQHNQEMISLATGLGFGNELNFGFSRWAVRYKFQATNDKSDLYEVTQKFKYSCDENEWQMPLPFFWQEVPTWSSLWDSVWLVIESPDLDKSLQFQHALYGPGLQTLPIGEQT